MGASGAAVSGSGKDDTMSLFTTTCLLPPEISHTPASAAIMSAAPAIIHAVFCLRVSALNDFTYQKPSSRPPSDA